MTLEMRSFRGVHNGVLLRADDNPEAALLFTHEGVTYPAVVMLDTNLKRVRISLPEGSFFQATTLAHDLWGEEGVEGDKQQALSPPTTNEPRPLTNEREPRGFYINDARVAAEYVGQAMKQS